MDDRARVGLALAWTALYMGLAGWVTSGVFVVGFRNDPYVGPWLVFPAALASLTGCALSLISRRRVKLSTSLHGALDFISTFAWHVCWTSLFVELACFSLYYRAYSEELQRLQEEFS